MNEWMNESAPWKWITLILCKIKLCKIFETEVIDKERSAEGMLAQTTQNTLNSAHAAANFSLNLLIDQKSKKEKKKTIHNE